VAAILRLEVTEFVGPARWSWRLSEQDGTFIAAHKVVLDTAAWQYKAMADLYQYLRLHAAPDRRLVEEARIVHLVGRWIGECVFGPVGAAIADRGPATIEVIIPETARAVAVYPLESAVVDQKALAVQGISLVLRVGEPAGRAKVSIGPRLRILGLFSLPDGASALNQRKERHELTRLLQQSPSPAPEFRVLQYGVTRERLRQVVADDEGWDIIHVSGHGRPGALLLETAAGGHDPIGARDLAAILQAAAKRVKLVVVSACMSAALTAAEQLYLLGLAPAVRRDGQEADEGQVAPVLATELASRLDCAVLAMRYPVTDEFAAAIATSVYEHVLERHESPASALALTLAHSVAGPPSLGCPPLSLATPAMFGRRAVDSLSQPLPAPARQDQEGAPARRDQGQDQEGAPPTGLPPQPERFVGRVAVMARAEALLAHGSDSAGLLLHGMAGAGKTACALELAYTHRDAFHPFIWFTVPDDEGVDSAGALARFVATLELRVPGLRMIHHIAESAAFDRSVEELTLLAERNRLLVIVDGAEFLLAPDGNWQDERWGQVLGALAANRGASRLIVTSRRAIAIPGTRLEAVHALSRDEAVLLARDLPRLRDLLDGRAHDVPVAVGRRAIARVLEVTQGHPKLLELADGAAADLAELSALLANAEGAWEESGGLPSGFFTLGHVGASDADYAQVLMTWATSIADRLPEAARVFFQFLCSLEEADRTLGNSGAVIRDAWDSVWQQAAGHGKTAPRPGPLLQVAADRALAAADLTPDGQTGRVWIHPLVATAVRNNAPPEIQRIVDTVMAARWIAVVDGADRSTGDFAASTVRAARLALPYLLRLKLWDATEGLLGEIALRDSSPGTVALLLPLARQLVRATAGTKEGLQARRTLAMLNGYVQPAAALTEAKQILNDTLKSGHYDIACLAAADVRNAYRSSGQLTEALRMAREMPGYSRQAGYGPWTQLADEHARLQIVADQGHYEEVLTDVEGLLARADRLPATALANEIVSPWYVREILLETGHAAAAGAGRWDRALDYAERRIASQRKRGAPAHEVASSMFNTYGPLLRLGRADDALNVLRHCHDVFEAQGDLAMAGMVLGALSQIEIENGHPQPALIHARDALRLAYLSGKPGDIAASHHNYGTMMAMSAGDLDNATAHRLAAAVVFALAGDGRLENPFRIFTRSSHPDVQPATPASVAAAVNRTDGVHFERLLNAVAPDPAVQQQAIDTILATARTFVVRPREGDDATAEPSHGAND
jgi:hypothetical protein